MQIDIPKPLRGRLEFGNAEQIAALQALERNLAEAEEEQRKVDSGELRKYEVDIALSGTATVVVLAASKKEAEKIAQEEYYHDPALGALGVESVTATEIGR